MATPPKDARGYVVDHKRARVRFAVSVKNYRPKVHKFVRVLSPQETVRGFLPKPTPKASTPTQDVDYVDPAPVLTGEGNTLERKD